MTFTEAQYDRAVGALLGTAVGDALGVPYEFESRPRLAADESAQMLGGGLGNFAPGQWSDDTSMAVAVATAGVDAPLTDPAALDAAASQFLMWYDSSPPDIGIQTRAVLSSTRPHVVKHSVGVAEVMTASSLAYAADHPRSAGNGALMRTVAVGITALNDRAATADAARAVARLTHADPLAVDSCVLWSEAIRVAVLEGRIDVAAGLDLLPDDRRNQWDAHLDAARVNHPNSFSPNGFTVTALQAAAASIEQTDATSSDHLAASLHTAIRIGNDTDTVAAIAGGLLGARWGASAIPAEWRSAVHGWPLEADENTLKLLATHTLRRQE